MGWVTLTLRKTELKGTHANYQKQLLDISREKRKMAREYHYEQTVVRNDMNEELRNINSVYDAIKDQALADMDAATTTITNANGTTTTQTNQAAYEAAKRAYDQAVEDAERERNEAKTRWEEELAQIEEEANADELLKKLQFVGEDKNAMLTLDKELAARVYTPLTTTQA